MPPALQTAVALGLAALALAYLLWSWLRPKKSPGCGGECGAVSPGVRELQSRLKRRRDPIDPVA
jgi:hypothetical protein